MISRRSGSLSNGFSRMIARLRAGSTQQRTRVRRSQVRPPVSMLQTESLEVRALLAANIIDSDISQAADVVESSVDESTVGDDLTVNTGVTVESTGGSVTLNAGDNLILTAGSSIIASTSVTLNLDASDQDTGVGATATLNAQFTAGSGVSVNGGGDADSIIVAPSAFSGAPLNVNGGGGSDSFEVDLTGVTNPVLTATGAGSFTITSDTHSTISLVSVESVSVASGSPDFSAKNVDLSASADGSADVYSLASDTSGNVVFTLAGQSSIVGSETDTTAWTVTGSSDNDTFSVDHSEGVIAAVINFAGGAGSDRLGVVGDGTTNGNYTPSATTTGSGTIAVTGAGLLTFSGLEPVDISGMATASLILPGTDDVIAVQNGTDFVTGATNAVVVGGLSAGVTIETAAFFNNTNLVIDTSTNDGDDTINIITASNTHGNVNIEFDTGTGSDAIVVNGNITTTGNLEISGPVTLNANVTLTAVEVGLIDSVNLGSNTLSINATGTNSLITGVVGGTGGIANLGSGNLKLDAANTYTGVTTVTAGQVWVNGSSALGDVGAASNTTVAAGTEVLVTGNFSVAEDLALAGSLAIGSANSAVWSGGITVSGGSSTIDSTLATSAVNVTGAISGSGGLTKAGIGQVSFSGVNTFTGATTLEAGTTIVNGELAAGANVVVENTAKLMGAGTIAGSVTVESGAELAPGNGPGIISTGDFDLQAGSTLTMEIDGITTAGTNYDQVNVAGTVTLAGTLAIVDGSTDTGAVANTITLINNDGTDAVSGTFDGLAQGASVTLNGESWRLLYNGGDGNDVVLVWGTPKVSIADASIGEGDSGSTTLNLTVTVDSPLGSSFRVTYATADNSANSSDYTAVNDTLTFAGLTTGETQTIAVSLTGDEIVELDETLLVTLTNILDTAVVTISDNLATGTITNDDAAEISINDVSIAEGDSGTTTATFTVTLDSAVDTGVSLAFDTMDDSATTANSDYVAIVGGALSFVGNLGETKLVSVTINGDTAEESDETFFVDLSGLSASGRSVSIPDAQGIGTIVDDDRIAVEFSATANTGTEVGTTVVTLTATAATAVSGNQTFDLNVSGTGISAADYVLSSSVIEILDGQTTGIVTFTVQDDAVVEQIAEVATIALTNPSGGVRVGTVGSQDITITDNDTATLSIVDVSLAEGDSGTTTFTFVVTLDNEVDTAVTVDATTMDDTATVANLDYVAASSTLTFAGTAGETQTIEVQVTGDATVELPEDFFVDLSNIVATGRNVSAPDSQATGTITNDDTATLSIDDVTVTEGDAGTANFTFTVTLSAAVDTAVTVDYDTDDDTATTADSDYVANTGNSLTFAGTAGETQTLVIVSNGDTKVEADETFFVNLSSALASGRSLSIADAQGLGTISNDDTGEAVDLSVSLNTGTEAAGTAITLTATSAMAVSGTQTVDVQVTGIGAGDYTLGSTTITIEDGQTTGTTTFTVIDDAVVELLESATVSLLNPSIGLSLGSLTSQVISIVDNDSALLSIADITMAEGNSGTTSFVFTVSLDTAVDSAVTVDYTTDNSTATAGSDFTTAANTLTFAGTAGETQTIEVLVTGDETVELTESFLVNLSSINALGRNVTFADNQARGTVTNDDTALLSIDNVSIDEGDSGSTSFVFTVTLGAAVDSAVSVDFSTVDGTATTANSDYIAVPGNTLAFTGTAGETHTLQVVITGDTSIEADEKFDVVLDNILASGRQVEFGDATGVGTILDDDGIEVELSVDVNTGTEASETVVTLTATSATAVAVSETVDVVVTGVAATDYAFSNTQITILPGQTTGTVTFTLVDDAVAEQTETAVLSLSNPSLGLSLGTTISQSISVTDNDSATLSIADVSVTEGDSGNMTAHFVVTLSADVDTGISINYNTSDGTATVADSDYSATSGTLNFAGTAGETQAVSVDITGDTIVELSQSFAVDLLGLNNGGRNVTVADAQGTGTITNDDSASLSIADVTTAEGDSGTTNVTFVVTLDNAVDTGFSVNATTMDGTATTADSDYAGNTGTLSFTGSAGETQGFQVSVTGDTVNEVDESFVVNLVGLSASGRVITIPDNQANGIISDDDGTAVNLAVSTSAGTEAGTTAITLIASAASAVGTNETVGVVVSGSGITTGDYSLSAPSITIEAGQQVGTVMFTVVNDDIVEPTESALITLANPSVGLSLGTTTSQTVSITSDDAAELRIADVAVVEGDSGTTSMTFTVTLDNAVAGGLTVDFTTADDTASATIGETDYVATNGTLTFAGTAGETQPVTVTVNGDTTVESNEAFFVNLANVVAAAGSVTIADSQGQGTITDDDTIISVSLSSSLNVGTEFGGTVITLTATTDQPVVGNQTVDVQVGGTNITTTDYLLSGPTIIIQNGQTVGTATFTVLADGTLEGTEIATVSLANLSSGIIAGTTTSVDISITDHSFVTLDSISNFPGDQPTVSWQPVSGAVRYEIWFARIFPQQIRIYSDTNISGTSWTPPAALASGFYRYWARAFDVNGNASGWSSENSFEVRPTLIAPVTPTFNQRPTFTWDAIPFAPGYEIFIRTTQGDIVVDDISGTSFTPSADLPTGPIRWWIRSSDAQANRGWSQVGLTDVDRRTTVTGPASPTTDTTPTITWNAVAGAGRYVLYVQDADQNTLEFRDDNVTETSYTPATALAAGNYRVWVKAIDASTNAFNSGLWSNAFEFEISANSQSDSNSPVDINLLPQLTTIEFELEKPVRADAEPQETAHAKTESNSRARIANVPSDANDESDLLDILMAQPIQLIDLLEQADLS